MEEHMLSLWNIDLNKLPSEQTVTAIRTLCSSGYRVGIKSHAVKAELAVACRNADVRVEKLPNFNSTLPQSKVSWALAIPLDDVFVAEVLKPTLRDCYLSGSGKRSRLNYLLDAFLYCALKRWDCYLLSKPGEIPIRFKILDTEMLLRNINSICYNDSSTCNSSDLNMVRLASMRRWFEDFPTKLVAMTESYIVTVAVGSEKRVLKIIREINSIVIKDSRS